MKKFLVLLAFLSCFQANAGLITIESDEPTSQINDVLTITLTGKNFDPFDFFTFDFTFDTSLYTFIPDSLTSALGAGLNASVPVDNSGIFFQFFQFDEFIPASAEFELASFQLNVIGLGQNIFNIEASSFFGFNGAIDARLDKVLSTSVAASNGSTPVSEPATLALLLLGSAGLIARRRKH